MLNVYLVVCVEKCSFALNLLCQKVLAFDAIMCRKV